MSDFGQPPGGGGFGGPPGGAPPGGGGFGGPPGGAPPGGGGFGAPPAGGGGFGGPPGAPQGGGFGAPAGGGFGAPGGGGMGPGPTAPKTETMAIISVVTGAIGVFSCCCACIGLSSLAAVILGGLSLSKIKQDPTNLKGKELAYVGIGLGVLGLLLAIASLVFGLLNQNAGGSPFDAYQYQQYQNY